MIRVRVMMIELDDELTTPRREEVDRLDDLLPAEAILAYLLEDHTDSIPWPVPPPSPGTFGRVKLEHAMVYIRGQIEGYFRDSGNSEKIPENLEDI